MAKVQMGGQSAKAKAKAEEEARVQAAANAEAAKAIAAEANKPDVAPTVDPAVSAHAGDTPPTYSGQGTPAPSVAEVLARQEQDAARPPATISDLTAVAQQNVGAIDDRFAKIKRANEAVLAAAADCAMKFQGTEVNDFMHTTVDVQLQNEYRPIRMYRYMKALLTPEQLARLPQPRSEYKNYSDPEEGSNELRPLHDIIPDFERVTWNGKITERTSFYRELLFKTPDGIRHRETMTHVEMAQAHHKDTPEEYTKMGSAKLIKLHQDATKALGTLLTALQQAAKIHLQITRFSNITTLNLDFRRDDTGEIEACAKPIIVMPTPKLKYEERTLDNGEKFLHCLNTPEEQRAEYARVADLQQSFTISQFIGWKLVPKFIALCNADKSKDGPIGRMKKAGQDPDKELTTTPPKTPDTSAANQAAASKYTVTNAGEMKQSLNDIVSWFQGANAEQHGERYGQLRLSIMPGKDDASVWSLVTLYDLLTPLMASEELGMRNRAAQYDAKVKADMANAVVPKA